MEKNNSFERELPSGYKEIKHINARDKKTGVIFNLIAFAVIILVMAIASLILFVNQEPTFETDSVGFILVYAVFIASMAAYVVLHELVHGIAYKALTGEKLTFGLSWSCAYCGVPNVYTYRRTALIALVAPFITFTVILLPITVWMYFVDPLYYLLSAFLLGLHLGGCSGDIYCTLLFLFKFKDKKTLMRDTGPEQFFYLPDQEDGQTAEQIK